MVLSVEVGRTWRYGESWAEMSGIIAAVLDAPGPDGRADRPHPPDRDAWFFLSDQAHSDEHRVADNYLHVSVNRSTGYGGLVWGVTERSPRRGGVFDAVWVSDNPEPPDFDPLVVSDPGYPLFFDPCSTLPVPVVRAALEEFCRTGTGARPESLGWVPGHVNGRRLDREYPVDVVEVEDPFAAVEDPFG